MLVIPAIDLQDGKAVRLTKGVLASPTVYSEDPPQLAERFKDAGVKRLHIVDLDGAKTGNTVNLAIIEKIAKLGMQAEIGGGIRDMDSAERVFNAGAAFVIVGTAAVKDKVFVMELAAKYPQKVILGIDVRTGNGGVNSESGFAAADGWQTSTKIRAADLAAGYKSAAVESIIFTDIEKDGTLGGVNLSGVASFADLSPFKVIASGGVASRKDIDDLKALSHPNIYGVIVGKAIYEKKIALSEIV
jgi:phosphoribosylformimino-5-aminoimidazole carboxamide ribotide isomerase